tara:strand:+ start:1044 stop:1382 length:339 start_codon:yes stop_codon:yes gene_type:complete
VKEYTEIEVTQDHIIDGVQSCSQGCAIALALMDSDLLHTGEYVDVLGYEDMFKEFRVGNEYYQIGIIIHPEDKMYVRDFIDWFDDGGTDDMANSGYHTLKFRAKLEQKHERI